MTNRYLQGPGLDNVFADEQVHSGSSTNYWTLGDHLGSVRDVVDNNGVVQKHEAYSAFGKTTIDSNPAVKENFAFAGGFTDQETGKINDYWRWYDPAAPSWMSQDPVGFWSADSNLARYAGNNPTANVDPTGLMTSAIGLRLAGPGLMLMVQANPHVDQNGVSPGQNMYVLYNGWDGSYRIDVWDDTKEFVETFILPYLPKDQQNNFWQTTWSTVRRGCVGLAVTRLQTGGINPQGVRGRGVRLFLDLDAAKGYADSMKGDGKVPAIFAVQMDESLLTYWDFLYMNIMDLVRDLNLVLSGTDTWPEVTAWDIVAVFGRVFSHWTGGETDVSEIDPRQLITGQSGGSDRAYNYCTYWQIGNYWYWEHADSSLDNPGVKVRHTQKIHEYGYKVTVYGVIDVSMVPLKLRPKYWPSLAKGAMGW